MTAILRMQMKRKDVVASCFIAVGVLLFVVGNKVLHDELVSTFGGIAACFGAFQWLRRAEGRRNFSAFEATIAKLDVIREGRRYLGSESEMIDWRRADNPRDPGPVCLIALCRTKSGNWFETTVEIIHGRARFAETKALREADARTWLRYDVAKYEKAFGKVDIA
jgi:hypothetical protein